MASAILSGRPGPLAGGPTSEMSGMLHTDTCHVEIRSQIRGCREPRVQWVGDFRLVDNSEITALKITDATSGMEVKTLVLGVFGA